MSLSAYPFAIPEFPAHRNLLDDVDATHINSIQREVAAIAGVLGIQPQVHTEVAVPQSTVATVPAAAGGDVAATIAYSPVRTFDPVSRDINYGTVASRLRALEKGQHMSVFRLAGGNVTLNVSSHQTPPSVRFPLPTETNDPGRLFNGNSVTIRKSGFWLIKGSVVFTLLGSGESQTRGVYQAAVDLNGMWQDGMDRVVLNPADYPPALSPSFMGYVERGTTVSLRVSQSSSVSQRMSVVSLAGVLLRES